MRYLRCAAQVVLRKALLPKSYMSVSLWKAMILTYHHATPEDYYESLFIRLYLDLDFMIEQSSFNGFAMPI